MGIFICQQATFLLDKDLSAMLVQSFGMKYHLKPEMLIH